MPWTAKSFKKKHWNAATLAQAAAAAKRANGMVKRGISEGNAIAIAISTVQRGGGRKK